MARGDTVSSCHVSCSPADADRGGRAKRGGSWYAKRFDIRRGWWVGGWVTAGLLFGPEFCRVQGNTGSAVAFREVERRFSSMITRVWCSGNGQHSSRSPGVIYPAVVWILLKNFAFFSCHGDAADDTHFFLLHSDAMQVFFPGGAFPLAGEPNMAAPDWLVQTALSLSFENAYRGK